MTTTTTITAGEARAMYDELLDEIHGEFAGHPGSKTLLAVDPIAYKVGLSDYIDMLESGDGYEIEED